MSSEQSGGMRPARPPRSTVERADNGTAISRPDERDEFMTDENVYILESWHSPLDPAMSIARGRLAPGATSVPHVLDGIEERYIIVAGQGELDLPGLGRRRVGPGDIVFFPATQPQSITNVGDSDLVLYAVCTPPFDENKYAELPESGE